MVLNKDSDRNHLGTRRTRHLHHTVREGIGLRKNGRSSQMYNVMSVRIPGRALYISVFPKNSLLSITFMFVMLCTLDDIAQH